MTHEEMILRAKEAKSAEELIVIAKENGLELTEEDAKAYYEKLHKTGEIADDELDNVSGGGCDEDNPCKPITVGYDKPCFKCGSCYRVPSSTTNHYCNAEGRRISNSCQSCIFYRDHDEHANRGDFCKR